MKRIIKPVALVHFFDYDFSETHGAKNVQAANSLHCSSFALP